MTRRTFAASALGAPLLRAATGDRPNILWVTCEDIGPHLHACGDDYSVTPNLDKLAADGVRYTRFYNGMVCSVSRSSFITGMYATTIGAHNHRTHDKHPLPEGVKTICEWMRPEGYFTANVKELPETCHAKAK